jgi:hypothetical protein
MVLLLVVMAVVLVVMLSLPMVGGGDGDGACDIRLSKKNAKDSSRWDILLPLNSKGLLREAPRKSTISK